MTNLSFNNHRTIKQISSKKYWRTYLIFGGFFIICTLINAISSVEAMYSSNNSQEIEFKKAQLSALIQKLEKDKAELVNLQQIQKESLALGFQPIYKLEYASTPKSQKVAER